MSRRALVAALGLLLLVLQMLATIPSARHAAGLSAGAATLSKLCEPHADDPAPPPARDDHAPCCVFCAAGRDGPLPPPIDLGAEGTEPAIAFSTRLSYEEDGPDGRPIGWASSWSSRAPPLG